MHDKEWNKIRGGWKDKNGVNCQFLGSFECSIHCMGCCWLMVWNASDSCPKWLVIHKQLIRVFVSNFAISFSIVLVLGHCWTPFWSHKLMRFTSRVWTPRVYDIGIENSILSIPISLQKRIVFPPLLEKHNLHTSLSRKK